MTLRPWLIYALGSGWGHLNRAVALARVVASQRPTHILANSPYLDKVESRLKIPNLKLHRLAAESLTHAKAVVLNRLLAETYECLIVDTFPRGLLGELAAAVPSLKKVHKVLIHRDLSPQYISTHSIAAFVERYYDQILIPGEAAAWQNLPQAHLTPPWISLSANELSPPDQLRDRLRLSVDRPAVLVCAAGQPWELAFWGSLTQILAQTFPSVNVRCLAPSCPPECSPDRWIDHWPGIEVLQLAQVVVGGGGYNTVFECAALGIPLVAFAQPRRYDRQARRLDYFGYPVETVESAIAAVQALLPPVPNWRAVPIYANGAAQAVCLIEQQLSG